jgi:hypothetical protein
MVAVPRGAEPRVSSNLHVKAFDMLGAVPNGIDPKHFSIQRSACRSPLCAQEDDLHSAATALLGAYANPAPFACRCAALSFPA